MVSRRPQRWCWASTGFIRYAQDGATNRDTALVGLAMGWIGLVVLLMRLAAALNLPPEAFSSATSGTVRLTRP